MGTSESRATAGRRGRAGAETVMLTGAGSGMGLECALHLAASGYRVFACLLNEAEEDALRLEAGRRGVAVRALRMDITRPDEISAAVDTMVTEAGRIDALVQ